MKTSLNFFIIIAFQLGLSIIIITNSQIIYLYHVCSDDDVFAKNSTYHTNLNQTLYSLSSNAGRSSTGFNYTTTGNVFGLFLCQGDLNNQLCKTCVTAAVRSAVQYCPVAVTAYIWYDGCLLRYSNKPFFSTLEYSPAFLLVSKLNVSDSIRFSSLVATSMREAVTVAVNSSSGNKKFSVKEANFTTFQTVHNLVQCTPDLSSSDCRSCLEFVISELMSGNGKEGGRYLTPSCFVRYEVYPFYYMISTESPEILPPPPITVPDISSSRGISNATIIAVVAPISVSVLFVCIGCIFLRRRARKKCNTMREDSGANEIITAESLQIDLSTIKLATNNFSVDNKLGEGRFAEVYKGTFPNRQEIAVKKLCRSSAQGSEEFKNEVLLLAKLQHRNLVRLLGFCLEGEEKILVYEYVPNKTLDFFLFDEEKRGQLDWSTRYRIIEGISRGILYLHEDSRLRIIHRDLKASNILLDGEMNPKVSDFGMAKILEVDQTQGNTSKIVGTYGYMSPEYSTHGQFSVKSDMYSFGVLVLEIICGKKNTCFHQTDTSDDLISYVWKHWREGTPIEVLDPVLEDSYSKNEVLRCIQIGLLCVQPDPTERPTMATIFFMLNSYSTTLPQVPQPPLQDLDSKDI